MLHALGLTPSQQAFPEYRLHQSLPAYIPIDTTISWGAEENKPAVVQCPFTSCKYKIHFLLNIDFWIMLHRYELKFEHKDLGAKEFELIIKNNSKYICKLHTEWQSDTHSIEAIRKSDIRKFHQNDLLLLYDPDADHINKDNEIIKLQPKHLTIAYIAAQDEDNVNEESKFEVKIFDEDDDKEHQIIKHGIKDNDNAQINTKTNKQIKYRQFKPPRKKFASPIQAPLQHTRKPKRKPFKPPRFSKNLPNKKPM